MKQSLPLGSLPALERFLALFQPHHQELRQRIGRCLMTIAGSSLLAYVFIERIAALAVRPLFQASPLVHALVYTNLPEAFITYLKLALFTGFAVSYPYLLWQLWAFVAPGLTSKEKRLALTTVFWGSLLFASGALFAFLIVLPKMLAYLLSYAHENLEPLPKFALYLTFIARTMLTLGLAFQIPFLQVMAGRSGLTSAAWFRKKRTSFYLLIIVLAFLLAAGDLMAALLLALPLFVLYEAGIYLTAFFAPAKQPANQEKTV